MAYGDFRDLARRTASNKVLCDKAFLNIVQNTKYDGYQCWFASVAYKCLDEKWTSANTSGGAIKSDLMSNQQLPDALHKPTVTKFRKHKVYSSFKYNICCAHLVNLQLIG